MENFENIPMISPHYDHRGILGVYLGYINLLKKSGIYFGYTRGIFGVYWAGVYWRYTSGILRVYLG